MLETTNALLMCVLIGPFLIHVGRKGVNGNNNYIYYILIGIGSSILIINGLIVYKQLKKISIAELGSVVYSGIDDIRDTITYSNETVGVGVGTESESNLNHKT